MLIYANPTKSPKKKKKKAPKTSPKARKRAVPKEAPVAKRKRSKARRRRVTVHKNPTHHRKTRKRSHGIFAKRRRHRNPSSFSGKGVLGEIMSKDGLMLIGGGVAGLTLPAIVQGYVMPTATGYTKLGVRVAIGAAGTWALGKLNRKAAIGFAVGALGGLLAQMAQAQMEKGDFLLFDEDGSQYGTPSMLGAYGQQALGAYGEQALGGIGMDADLGEEDYAN